MTHSNDPSQGGNSRSRGDRIHCYSLIRKAALTAIELIHLHFFSTRAAQEPSVASQLGIGSADGGIQDFDFGGDDKSFLSHLESLHETIQSWSTELTLPTRGQLLWSDFIQGVRSGDRSRERAEALCNWIEECFNVNTGEILHLDEDMKILTVRGEIYDASCCFVGSKMLEYYYRHRDRILKPGEIHVRVLAGRGSENRVKEIFESLPAELRGMVKPVPGAGRIWCG